MRKYILKSGTGALLLLLLWMGAFAQTGPSEYVVLVRESTQANVAWGKVVDRLVERHQAKVVTYQELTSEALPRLRELYPRYVAVVDKPEQISREFVIDLNRMSREVDEDPYADFLWGIITGVDAEAALRLVEKAATPQTLSSAWCLGLEELKDGKYFQRMGWTDGKEWIEKNSLAAATGQSDVLSKSLYWAEHNHPEIVIWGVAGQPERMPLQKEQLNAGIVPRNGGLWLDECELKWQDNARICFLPMMYGNPWGKQESFPVAWLNGGKAGALVSGMDFSTFGKGTWGTLQFWLTDAGRFSLAEAQFLNQQDLLCCLNQWAPEKLREPYAYDKDPDKSVFTYFAGENEGHINQLRGINNAYGAFNYWYERDLMVYYGDPAWDVRADNVTKDQPYTVSYKMKGKKCTVTVKTAKNFSWDRLCGDIHRQVGSLPVCYFFPQRLKHPRLAEEQEYELKVIVDENFLFVYDAYFKPGKKYKIGLVVEN